MKASTLNIALFCTVLGLAVGVGLFTFVYAKGYSYLTNDPAACANCHVMDEYYDAWLKGSHHSVAVCNDCHTPHNFLGKYASKASNGFWHSFAFTTGVFPDPLQIKPGNHRVTEGTCRVCHGDMVEAIEFGAHRRNEAGGELRPMSVEDDQVSCIRCHSNVGHWVR